MTFSENYYFYFVLFAMSAQDISIDIFEDIVFLIEYSIKVIFKFIFYL
jgi:hypothetical protein